MKVPSFITHYHLADRQPFLTLSDLENGSDSPIFQELRNRHKYDAGYQRRYGTNYINTRRKIENDLRRLFIERGGKPIRNYPFYFVLGASTWLKHLAKEHLEVSIPICDLNPETTSFTFPDSYVALSDNKKPYHGKVFLLHELNSLISEYGMPCDDDYHNYERYWEGDFEKYIEFQIWENNIVEPFIDRYYKEIAHR
ncbi:hypothetical protein SPB21_06105 [Leptothoe sp. ISB3NOV94-8A]